VFERMAPNASTVSHGHNSSTGNSSETSAFIKGAALGASGVTALMVAPDVSDQRWDRMPAINENIPARDPTAVSPITPRF